MRNKDRIEPVLARIGNIWRQHPDLRLGQLIINLQSKVSLYYIEDEKLVKALEEFYHTNETDS